MDSLFGVEMPLPAKLVVAFIIVLALIGLATWVIRRVGGGKLAASAPRGRAPRLAVIDAAAVDGRRRLVLIRRDNVEHLIMIGGPTDVVIEQNIMRAVPVAQPREMPVRAPEAAGDLGHEPLRMPEAPPRPQPRFEQPQRPMRAGEPPRRPAPRPEPAPTALRPQRRPDVTRPARTSITQRLEAETVEVESAPPTADANLTDMALRLEAALRRPAAPGKPESTDIIDPVPLPEPTPPTAPESNGNGAAPELEIAGPVKPESKTARTETKGTPPKSVFDSLEEEMASLLGRPAGKE
ncbi:MAG: flagellar biosynthesis protein FliO [Variibacter sp.]